MEKKLLDQFGIIKFKLLHQKLFYVSGHIPHFNHGLVVSWGVCHNNDLSLQFDICAKQLLEPF
jgi:hypothetical protein